MKKIIRRVLRKLTLFDLILLGSVAALLAVFFVFFYRKSEYITIRVKVTDQDVLYASTQPQNWYANRFEIGDVELDAAGRKITEIVGVERFSVSSMHQSVYVDLRVKATYDTRTKTYSARGKAVRFGTPMRFNLAKVTFDGIVTEFPNSNANREVVIETRRVLVAGKGIDPFLAEAIAIDDVMNNSNGTVLAKVLDKRVELAERVTQNSAGDLLLRRDPLYKDLYLELELRTKTVNGTTYVFDDIPLKIGEQIPVIVENVSLAPQIVEIFEE